MKSRKFLSIGVFLSLLTPFPLLACAHSQVMADTGLSQSISDRQNDATWEKAHALYLHDLAFASLDRSNRENFQAKSDLINARMYLAYAEADQLDLGSLKKAKQDIKESRNYISRAISADNNPRSDDTIRNFEKKVKLSAIDDSKSCNFESPRKMRDSFDQVKGDIDALMVKL